MAESEESGRDKTGPDSPLPLCSPGNPPNVLYESEKRCSFRPILIEAVLTARDAEAAFLRKGKAHLFLG